MFDNPKKLVAFAGIDPSIFESGRFKGTVNRITKRGSRRLRHALFMAVRSAIRDARKQKTTDEIIPRNKKLRAFYDKKREKRKPYKVAIIACANKLLHWIYAMLKSNLIFQDIAYLVNITKYPKSFQLKNSGGLFGMCRISIT